MTNTMTEAVNACFEASHRAIDAAQAASQASDLAYAEMGRTDDTDSAPLRKAAEAFAAAQDAAMALADEAMQAARKLSLASRGKE